MFNSKTFSYCITFLFFLYPALTSAQNTEFRFVGWKPEAPQVWDQAVTDFERQNPGIKIVREIGPHSSTQFHDLLTQKLKNRDTQLDVFFMDVIWPAEFASAGWALRDDKRLVSELDQSRAVEAVRFVRDRIIGEISHRGVLTYEEPESLALFAQGRAIFHRNWPYAWAVTNDPKTSRIAGKVGMMPLPSFPGGRGVAALGGWQLGVSRFSTKPDLAWRFVAFMTSKEIQKRIALSTGRAPTRLSLYDDPEISAKVPQLKALLETFKQAVPRPTTPVYVPLSNIMQRYFSSVLALPDTDLSKRAD